MDDILTQLAALEDLQSQRAPQLDAVQTALTLAESQVKAAVLAYGRRSDQVGFKTGWST